MKLHRSALLCLLSICIACGEDPPGVVDGGGPGDPDGGTDIPDSGPVINSDADMDGQDDDWERAHGLDPTRDDANDDLDADGISNVIEFLGGTKPNDIDSDDDGLADGVEDANQNGVVDARETGAASADTDGDGIPDGVESGVTEALVSPRQGILGTDPDAFVPDANPATRTDPTDADTDGDNIPDGVEDANRDGRLDGAETNPLDLDTDDDGILDGLEDANLNGAVDSGETDARDPDTDGDGIWDGVEIGINTPVADPDGNGPLLGTDVNRWRPDADPATMTNPLGSDTDGDGVLDGDEDWNHNGRYDPPAELDPNNPDSDGDGVSDGNEGVAVVCAESALRQVTLHQLASADIAVALLESYSEVSVLREASGIGVGLMFADPSNGVVGFAISKTPTGNDVQSEKQRNRNLLNGVANLSNEQDRALYTWDGFDAVFTTANATQNNVDPIELAAQMAEAVAGQGGLTGALPAGGAEPGSFTVFFETILRSQDRAIVLGAIAPAPSSDAQIIALSDLANGTGIAQFGDFTGVGCDQFTTPEGNDIVDLLWVVDNSCSMSEEQANVAAVGQEMVALLTNTQLSWRLALTTTDQADGSLTARGVNGFTVSSPRATAETESQGWAAAVGALGTGGSGQEQGLVVGLTAANLALQNITPTESRTTFRQGASVIIVHMSDEEDFTVKQASGGNDESCPENAGKQSRITELTNQYVALTQAQGIAGLTTFAIHGIQPNNTGANFCNFAAGAGDCLGASQHGRAYIDVASAMGGGSGSICGDMGQVVQDIIRAGAGIASQIELTQPPISSTIRVVIADESGSFVGRPDVPRSRQNGFDYAFELDVPTNTLKHKIVFYGTERPPANRELMISYRTWQDGSPDPSGPVCECPDGQICNGDDNECVVDPECGTGCPQDMVCNPNTGMCEEPNPCNNMCGPGEQCLDGMCVEEDPCQGLCGPGQICDRSTDPPTCIDV
jgi:hypothetical protein